MVGALIQRIQVKGNHSPLLFLVLAACLVAAPFPVAGAHEQHGKDAARSAMNKHWQDRLTAAVGSAASVAIDESGRLWLARMEKGHVLVSRSDDEGRTFVDEVKVNPQPEAVLADGQNRPKIVAGGGVLAVTWAQALPKLHSGHVRFARSVDGGKSFSAPRIVNDDREEIGHSFGTIALDGSGKMALVWLDGRERKPDRAYRGSSVYYVVSEDRGATFSANRKLADHSCECCRIGLAYTPDGQAWAQWRHVFGDNIRDFAMAALVPGSKLVRASEDNWQIAACPHHGGDLAIDESGRRHLVWFTGSPDAPGLFYRYADADQFSAPVRFGNLDAQAGNPTVFARNGQVYLAWREYDGKQYRALMQVSADRGQSWSAPREVAVVSGAADFPLFVAGATRPLLAWYAEGRARIFNLEHTK